MIAQTATLSNTVARPEIGNRQQGGAHPGWRLGGAFGKGFLVAVSEASGRNWQHICSPAMANRDTSVAALAAELGVKSVTLYRYVDANGNLRDHGKRVLSA